MEGRKGSTMLKYFDATPSSATAWGRPKGRQHDDIRLVVQFAWQRLPENQPSRNSQELLPAKSTAVTRHRRA